MGRPAVYEEKIRMHVSTDAKIKDRLQILADKTGKNLSQLVNEAMTKVLDDYAEKGTYSDIDNDNEKKGERENMLTQDGKTHEAKFIVFSNNKGGAAKTTTCTSLAVLFNNKNYRVLVIDLDMQKNASDLLGYRYNSKNPSVADYLSSFFDGGEKEDIKNIILGTKYSNVDVIVADRKMQGTFEQHVRDTSADRGDLIGHLFRDIRKLNIYDIVLVDTQPSMGVLVTSSYKEADYIIIPTEPDIHGIEGAQKVCSFVKMRRNDGNKIADIAGILFVRAVAGTQLSKLIPTFKASLEDGMKIHCFNTMIPQSTDVPKARMERLPVTDKYPNSKVSKNYAALLTEVEEIING